MRVANILGQVALGVLILACGGRGNTGPDRDGPSGVGGLAAGPLEDAGAGDPGVGGAAGGSGTGGDNFGAGGDLGTGGAGFVPGGGSGTGGGNFASGGDLGTGGAGFVPGGGSGTGGDNFASGGALGTGGADFVPGGGSGIGGSYFGAGGSSGGSFGQPLPPDTPLPTGCEPEYYESFGDYCRLRLSCENGSLGTTCATEGQSSSCQCEGRSGGRNLRVKGVPTSQACATAALQCAEPSTARVCQRAGETFGQNYCVADELCTAELSSTGGVSVEDLSQNNSQCTRSGTSWACSCFDGASASSLEYELPGTEPVRAACAGGLDICRDGSNYLTGPMQCELEQFSSSSSACTLQQKCRQGGTAPGGAPIEAIRTFSSSCYRGSGNNFGSGGGPGLIGSGGGLGFFPFGQGETWTCTCGARPFELAGNDAYEVCQDAGETCAARFQ